MSLVEVKSAEASFKDSILQLQSIFSHFDKLGSEGVSGAISVEKLGEALRESLGLSFSEGELRDMVAAVDLNASNDIQFNEFLKMMDQAKNDAALLNPMISVQDLKDGLAAGAEELVAADADGDADPEQKEQDVAERKSAAAAAARLQAEAEYVMTRDDIKAVFNVFDSDGDGRVSAAELQAMLAAQGEKYAEEEVHAMVSAAHTGAEWIFACVRTAVSGRGLQTR